MDKLDTLIPLAIAAEAIGIKDQTIRKNKHKYPLVQAKPGARIYMLLSDVYKLQGIFTPQKINCKVNYEEVEDEHND